MPKYKHCFKAYSPIVAMEVLKDNRVIFSTTNSGIRVLDMDEYNVLSNILPQELDAKALSCFSKDGRLVAIAHKTTVYIMVLRTQKILKTIETRSSIDVLTFDTLSNYIIIGTSDGRVYQYRFNSNTLLARLCSFPYLYIDEKPKKIDNNFVSVITSYKDKIACSGYGGAIYVMNLHSRDSKKVILRQRVKKIESLCFLDNNTLISGSVDGVVEVIDLHNTKKIQRLNAPFTHVKHIIPMPNKEYILVASDKNFIALLNIKSLKIVKAQYLEFDEKIKLMIPKDEESFFVVLQDGSVKSVELLNLATLRSLIEKDKLTKAYRLLSKAPMLRGSKEERELEKKYQKLLEKAIKMILDDDMEGAKELLKNVSTLPSKKEEIRAVFEGFKHYEKLQLMFHEEKLHVAYSLCEKFPALKYTKEYKSMEKAWQNTFLKAQKEMLLHNVAAARALLGKYMAVHSKRTLIQFILYQNQEFIQFLKAIENKEFEQLHSLAKEYREFSALEHYKVFQEEVKNTQEQIEEFILMGNTHLAEVLIEKLDEDPKNEELVQKLEQECSSVSELYEAYKKNNLLKCYKKLDSDPFLKTTDLGKELETKWYELIDKGEKLALKADIKGVEEIFSEFKHLTSRNEKVGDIFRVAYQRKIFYFLQHKNCSRVATVVNEYTDKFGLDTEIKQLIKEYAKICKKKINLTAKQVRRKPRDYWLFC